MLLTCCFLHAKFIYQLHHSSSFVLAPTQIDWDNRLEDDIFNDCLASVDGVDCLYKTKRGYDGKPDKRFYSYKYKKSGLRYEVCVAIRSNNIVWINGPFLPGEYNDLQIFRMGLKQHLQEGERVEADDIYESEAPHKCYTPRHCLVRQDQKLMRNRIKKRHETINRRLKVFKSLNVVFTHSVERHLQYTRLLDS